MARDVRNYLIFVYCATNALRSSNIIEMTLENFNKATKMPDSFPKGRVIKSIHYKTSFLYGEKGVCIAEEIYVQSIIYKDYLQRLFMSDDKLPESER